MIFLLYAKEKRQSKLVKGITFYESDGGPLINIDNAINLYQSLDRTPFVTPYSTLSWAEDIAELFTVYYLVSVLNCNFETKIYEDDNLIYTYQPLNRELLVERFKYINSF